MYYRILKSSQFDQNICFYIYRTQWKKYIFNRWVDIHITKGKYPKIDRPEEYNSQIEAEEVIKNKRLFEEQKPFIPTIPERWYIMKVYRNHKTIR